MCCLIVRGRFSSIVIRMCSGSWLSCCKIMVWGYYIVGFSLISMYMMDVNFIADEGKFLSGILQALSAQIALELPSTTVLTKCDLM